MRTDRSRSIALLAIPAVVAVIVVLLVASGRSFHASPWWYFEEGRLGTFVSIALLAGCAWGCRINSARAEGEAATFWRLASFGFVLLAADEAFLIHERVDKAFHWITGLDPDNPWTDHLDDAILAFYGVAAVWLAWRYRRVLAALPAVIAFAVAGFALAALMLVVDVLGISGVLEDGAKLIAGAFLLSAVLAARIPAGDARSRLSDPGPEV